MHDSREQQLRRATDSLEGYIRACFLFVVIGVFFEAVFNSATCLHKVGSHIVWIGLAAEWGLGIRVLRNEKELRGILDATIAQLNLENAKLKQQIAGNRFEQM